MIKAIFFDCFGVLYPDTFWTMAHEFLGDELDEHRQKLHDLVKAVDFGNITRDELWHEFARIVDEDAEVVYARLKEFSGLDKRLLRFIEQQKRQYKFGMISNVGQGFIERMFTEKPVEHYFDTVVLSSDVGLVKPDPEIYKLAASNVGCNPSECVFIDDIEKNITGAEKVGMIGIHYTDYASAIRKLKQLLNISDTDK